MSRPAARVDAVLCNFNQARWLALSLTQLVRQTSPLHRIHVVDNASTDESVQVVESIAARSPIPVEIHRRPTNSGGAGGFAYGTTEAMRDDPDFVLLQDGDAFPREDTVERLVAHALARPDLGMVGPAMYFAVPDAHDWPTLSAGRVVQEVGAVIDWADADYILRHHRLDDGAADGPQARSADVDYIAACTVLARGEAIRQAGTMDPSFFIYWDDIDWATRIKRAGYTIEARADAASWHVGGARVRTSLLGSYYHWRNRVRFFATHGAAHGHPGAAARTIFLGLRAAFVCRWFGQTNAADLIECAIDDALAGRQGARAFAAEVLAVQPARELAPAPGWSDRVRWLDTVGHILDLPPAVLGHDHGRTIVTDRFGKRLWLKDAVAARAAFDRWYAGRHGAASHEAVA